ncbi:hypothetical protein KKC_01694 [Listeria fleischmannii subsp. coloradonensis]|nr:hypothetical protein KKC_01694 [Listeria fleischmannii subsp. coloradonensis]
MLLLKKLTEAVVKSNGWKSLPVKKPIIKQASGYQKKHLKPFVTILSPLKGLLQRRLVAGFAH